MHKTIKIKVILSVTLLFFLSAHAFSADPIALPLNEKLPYKEWLINMGYKQERLIFDRIPRGAPSSSDLDRKLKKILLSYQTPPDLYKRQCAAAWDMFVKQEEAKRGPFLQEILIENNEDSFIKNFFETQQNEALLNKLCEFKIINSQFERLSQKHDFECIVKNTPIRAMYIRDFVPLANDEVLVSQMLPPEGEFPEGFYEKFRERFKEFYRLGFHPSIERNELKKCGYGRPIQVHLSNEKEKIRGTREEYRAVISDALSDPTKVRKTVGLYDGGNIMTLTNALGEKVTLLGESTITINLMILKEMGYFENNLEAADWVKRKVAHERWNDEDPRLELFRKFSQSKEVQPQEERKELDVLEDLKQNAYIFYAQWDYVKTVLIPKDIPGKLVFVTMLDYHLDVFLAPVPGGGLLLKDLEKSTELLKQMAPAISSPHNPNYQFNHMLEETSKAAQILADVTTIAVDELTAAGFRVIRAPTTYIGGKADQGDVNFLNPIYGKTSAEHYFWATLAPYYEDNLYLDSTPVVVEELKRAWTIFMKDFVFHGYELDFEFLKNKENETGAYAGAHCLYAELP